MISNQRLIEIVDECARYDESSDFAVSEGVTNWAYSKPGGQEAHRKAWRLNNMKLDAAKRLLLARLEGRT
jgi:hypothetical protein